MDRLPKALLFLLALALLVGLAAPALADEAKGKIKSITPDKRELVVTDNNNQDRTFHLNEDAKVRLNNKDQKLDDLKRGDQVTITFEKKGDKLLVSEIRCNRE
jgi:Cu/Ag efflux protein CusF